MPVKVHIKTADACRGKGLLACAGASTRASTQEGLAKAARATCKVFKGLFDFDKVLQRLLRLTTYLYF